MSNKVPNEPYCGPVAIDVSQVADVLVDVPPGGVRYLRHERPGIEEVIHELEANFDAHASDAGIPPQVYKQFVATTHAITRLREARKPLSKLLEVMNESEAKLVHERENAISQMADSIRSTAKRAAGPSIRAPFEKLLAYNAQAAEKAAQTRRRNAKAEAEAAETESTEGA